MKGVIEFVGDQDHPTSSLATTAISGQIVDLQNITGKKKLELIMNGEMGIDQFVTPANMVGSKLKVLREAHRAKVEEQIAKVKGQDFKVGDFVTFKGKSYEVLKVDSNRVKFEFESDSGDKAKVWVAKDKVTKG